jgi:hypothetical protein
MPIPTDKELITGALNDTTIIFNRQRNGFPDTASQLLDNSQLHELHRIQAMIAPDTQEYVEQPKSEPEARNFIPTNAETERTTEQAGWRVTRSMKDLHGHKTTNSTT